MDDYELARGIAREVADAGGRVYYVGGFVRDRLLGRENKDVDIEVHGVETEALEQILAQFGAVATKFFEQRRDAKYQLDGKHGDIVNKIHPL